MAPWIERPAFDLDYSAPLATRFEAVPADAIAAGKTLLFHLNDYVNDLSKLIIPLVQQRTDDRFQEEVEAIAAVFRVDWRDVLIANISYDLTVGVLGCSTVALATADGPVAARNMDWFPEEPLARGSYLLHNVQEGNRIFSNAGWPGSIGVVTGMSGNGFGVVLNAVLSPEGSRTDGYPVMLYIRKVLEDAGDFDEAVEMLTQETLASPALFTVVGTQNHQRVVIERSPSKHALRWGEPNTPLVATNDYRKLYAPQTNDAYEIYQTTCSRYSTLCNFFSNCSDDARISDDQLLYTLSDPGILATITAQHIIMRPADGHIRLFSPRRFFEAA